MNSGADVLVIKVGDLVNRVPLSAGSDNLRVSWAVPPEQARKAADTLLAKVKKIEDNERNAKKRRIALINLYMGARTLDLDGDRKAIIASSPMRSQPNYKPHKKITSLLYQQTTNVNSVNSNVSLKSGVALLPTNGLLKPKRSAKQIAESKDFAKPSRQAATIDEKNKKNSSMRSRRHSKKPPLKTFKASLAILFKK